MRKIAILYLFLIAFFILQLANMRITVWFPDLTLIVLIYASVFSEPLPAEALVMGFFLGLARGMFSPYLLAVDIILFPSLAYVSHLFAKLFYGYSRLAQVFITAFSASLVIVAHFIAFSVISSSREANLPLALLDQWQRILTTAISAPFFFALFERLTARRRKA
jgi:cell shape-determining protein MreD